MGFRIPKGSGGSPAAACVTPFALGGIRGGNGSDGMMDSEELAQVIRRISAGDTRSFGQIVLSYQDEVRACLAVRLRDYHEAEDLAQEVFVVAFRRLGEFDPERPMGPWLRGIALNLLRNHMRKRRATPASAGEHLDRLIEDRLSELGDPDLLDRGLAAMRQCLDRLGSGPRKLMSLRYEEGLSMADLSARTGKKHSAVTMQLHRLRLKLKECMEARLSREKVMG